MNNPGSRMNTWLPSIVVLLLSPIGLFAQDATIFPFLRGNISARAASLGGATVAMPEDIAMVVMNPACLSTIDTGTIAATFIKHILDINSGFAVYGNRLDHDASFGVFASFTSYGSFERTTSTGEIIGTFTAADVAAAFSYSKPLDTLISWGASIKLLHSSIESQSSMAIALDAGLLFQVPSSRTNVGLSLLNAGVQVTTYDGVSNKLPLDIRIGVNHRLKGLPMLVNFSLNHLADAVPTFFDRFLNFSVGGELTIGKYVRARVGYDNSSRNLSSVNVATQLSGVSGGIGIVLNMLHIDYALSSIGSEAILHRMSVGLPL